MADRGWGWRPGPPTYLGKAQNSPAACGRPAWRPHSGAFNKHEIIILGAAVVAAAATLLCLGSSPGGKTGLGAHPQPVPFSSPRRGRAETREKARKKGGPEKRGGEDLSGDREHQLEISQSGWGEFGGPK